MDPSLKLIFTIGLLLFVSGSLLTVHASTSYKPTYKPSKLFVFGDSYVDAGNSPKSTSDSWKPPYGETFPGEAAGRWSNGRVWSDFVAKFLGLKSPVAYELRSAAGENSVTYGMNFAYGGTGVFDTLSPLPNVTVQIDHLEQLINDKLYNSSDLESSVALLAISGNDYFAFLSTHGFNETQAWLEFISKVVNQMVVDAERIRGLGVKKIAINSIAPLGCVPYISSFNSSGGCYDTANTLAVYHNLLLQQAIAKLNNQKTDNSYIYVDFYTTFLTILENHGKHPGSSEFENPLKACCAGTNTTYNCGSVDANGVKQYTVCADPNSSFFWDKFHPTQYGWRDVYLSLRKILTQL